MLKIPLPSPSKPGWLCGKEGGRRGFPAQERLHWPRLGETKGAGRTLGKVSQPAWCWPPWGHREGTAPGGAEGAELLLGQSFSTGTARDRGWCPSLPGLGGQSKQL